MSSISETSCSWVGDADVDLCNDVVGNVTTTTVAIVVDNLGEYNDTYHANDTLLDDTPDFNSFYFYEVSRLLSSTRDMIYSVTLQQNICVL